MAIYAIFLCMQATGQCQMVEGGRYSLGDYLPGTTYQSLDECRFAIHHEYAPTAPHDKKWRFKVGNGMWYVCLGRHVDTWEQPEQ